MDLFIFPQGATLSDGYGIGVEYAYRRLLPQKMILLYGIQVTIKTRCSMLEIMTI